VLHAPGLAVDRIIVDDHGPDAPRTGCPLDGENLRDREVLGLRGRQHGLDRVPPAPDTSIGEGVTQVHQYRTDPLPYFGAGLVRQDSIERVPRQDSDALVGGGRTADLPAEQWNQPV